MLEFVIGISVLSLIIALLLSFYILKKPAGSQKMQEISEAIHQGALTFLKKEYEVLIVFLVLVALIMYLFLDNGAELAISFIIGGLDL